MHRRSATRRSILVVAPLVLLLLSGCRDVNPRSTMPGQKSPPGTVDACLMLTRPEVEQILGESAGAGTRGRQEEPTAGSPSVSECRYDLDEGRAIELLVQSPPGGTPDRLQALAWVREQAGARDGAATGTPGAGEAVERIREIGGVGDGAFWSEGQLHVIDADDQLYLVVTMTGFEDERALELARQIAATALR